MREKVNEIDVCVRKKDFKKVSNKEAEFEDKEKRVFQIILGQCSPTLRLQLEGASDFI